MLLTDRNRKSRMGKYTKLSMYSSNVHALGTRPLLIACTETRARVSADVAEIAGPTRTRVLCSLTHVAVHSGIYHPSVTGWWRKFGRDQRPPMSFGIDKVQRDVDRNQAGGT